MGALITGWGFMGHPLVALVLYLTSGHISPQFHVVFDDNFGTIPYMREGTILPHWAELVQNSAEVATDEDFDIAKTWFEGVEDPSDTLPFDISLNPVVSLTPANEGTPLANKGAPIANKGANMQPTIIPPVSPSKGADSLLTARPPLPPVEIDDNDPYDLNAHSVSSDADTIHFQASEGDPLKMPKRLNLEKSGLC